MSPFLPRWILSSWPSRKGYGIAWFRGCLAWALFVRVACVCSVGFSIEAAAAQAVPAEVAGGTGLLRPMASAELVWLDGHAPAAGQLSVCGVPWPRGTLAASERLVLRARDGAQLACQTWPLAQWPDGSVKWTGVALLAPENAAGGLVLAKADGKAEAHSTPGAPVVTVRESGQGIEVDTGVLRCLLPRSGETLISSLRIEGREVGRAGRLIVLREDRTTLRQQGAVREEAFVGVVERLSVEQSGPVRAVVRLEGVHRLEGVDAAGARRWLPFVVRLYFGAGSASVRLVHSFVFDGDASEDFIKGLGCRFEVPLREELHNRHLRLSGEGERFLVESVHMSPGFRDRLVKDAARMFLLQQRGERLPALAEMDEKTRRQFGDLPAWGDYRLLQLGANGFSLQKRTGEGCSWLQCAEGGRAGGVAYVGDVSGGLAVGLRNFWRKGPSSLEVAGADGDRAVLSCWFWSPQASAMDLRHYSKTGHGLEVAYEDYQEGSSTPLGVANSSELILQGFSRTPAVQQLSELAAGLEKPPVLACSPRWYHEAGVFGVWSLPDTQDPLFRRCEEQLARAFSFFEGQVGQRGWYGFWNYGDLMRSYDVQRHEWRYDVGGHAWLNTELMPDAWLWYYFLRSGRADVYRMAEAMTRHTSEVDVYHGGRFAGLGTRHNVSHWGCGAKECRISQAFLKRFFYYLSTDERTGDLMREVLGADLAVESYPPLRKVLPRQDGALLVRSGPDWLSFAGNWMTEWERTGQLKYRDWAAQGMRDLGAMPEALRTRLAFRYDTRDKSLHDVGGPNIDANHFITIFGGDQIAYELMGLIDCPEFVRAWDGLQEAWVGSPKLAGEALTRALAHVAWRQPGKTRVEAARRALEASLRLGGVERFPVRPRLVDSALVPRPVEENEAVDPAGTAQWALGVITSMELLRRAEAAPAPKAPGKP